MGESSDFRHWERTTFKPLLIAKGDIVKYYRTDILLRNKMIAIAYSMYLSTLDWMIGLRKIVFNNNVQEYILF